MTKIERDTLCRIAEMAGQEIMAVYRDGGETWQKDRNKQDIHFS